MSNKAVNEFAFHLANLVFHSKTLINVLTSLAEENSVYAVHIVKLVEDHLSKVEPSRKLLTIYLIDSIVKKIRGIYTELFERNIARAFCSLYEEVDTERQFAMIRLRMSWYGVFSQAVLKYIDRYVREPELIIIPIHLPYTRDHVDDRMECSDKSLEFAYDECRNIVKRYRVLEPSPPQSPKTLDDSFFEPSMNELSLGTVPGQLSTMDAACRLLPISTEEEMLQPLSSTHEIAENSDQIVIEPFIQQLDHSYCDYMNSDMRPISTEEEALNSLSSTEETAEDSDQMIVKTSIEHFGDFHCDRINSYLSDRLRNLILQLLKARIVT